MGGGPSSSCGTYRPVHISFKSSVVSSGKCVTKVLHSQTNNNFEPDGTPIQHGDNREFPGCGVPGAPLVLYNIGSEKRLHFQLQDYYTGLPIPDEEFYVRQSNNHAFVLDVCDEVPGVRGKTNTKYLAYWAHDCELVQENGVAITIKFRFGNDSIGVDPATHRLRDSAQTQELCGKFDAAADKPWMSGPDYNHSIAEVHRILRETFAPATKQVDGSSG